MSTVTPDQLAALLQAADITIAAPNGAANTAPKVPVNSTPSASTTKYNYRSTDPTGPITDKHRNQLVQLAKSKILPDEPIVIDGEFVEFTDEAGNNFTVSFADLKSTEDRVDENGNAVLGTRGNALRHYPYICGLSDGEAVAILNQVIGFANLKSSTSNGNNGFRRQAAPAAAPQRQPAEEDRLAKLIAKAEAVLGLVAEKAEPAKPVPANGHLRVVRPASPVQNVTDLAEGQICRWNGELIKLTVQANGRMGYQKV